MAYIRVLYPEVDVGQYTKETPKESVLYYNESKFRSFQRVDDSPTDPGYIDDIDDEE